eukprot:GEMP01064322.1.p1 GENE.GEMP01064322.1~~GEMP01064322.1.p1  ORF type:complete len:240 (+),score=15.89 GEMP01064322.1:58-777(+)
MRVYFAFLGSLWGSIFLAYILWLMQGCRAAPFISELGLGGGMRSDVFRYGLICAMLFCWNCLRRVANARLKIAYTLVKRLVVRTSFIAALVSMVSLFILASCPFNNGYEKCHFVGATSFFSFSILWAVSQTIGTYLLYAERSRTLLFQVYMLIVLLCLGFMFIGSMRPLFLTMPQIIMDAVTLSQTDFDKFCRQGYIPLGVDGSDRLAPMAALEWLLIGTLTTFGLSMAKEFRMQKSMD